MIGEDKDTLYTISTPPALPLPVLPPPPLFFPHQKTICQVLYSVAMFWFFHNL